MAKTSGSPPVLIRLIRHRSLIKLLLGAGRPAAVARTIVAAVIGIAVNRVLQTGTLTHIFQEVLEDKPARVNPDPKGSVVLPMFAAVFHRLPGLISRGYPALACNRINSRMSVLQVWLTTEHIRTLLVTPRTTVASALAAWFTFSHITIVHVIPIGGN